MSDDTPSKFWDNPYWAPLAVPLKNVARITMAPLNHFKEAIKAGTAESRYDESPKVFRILKELVSTNRDSALLSVGNILFMAGGGVTGGILGAFGGYGMAAAGGMGVQLGASILTGVAATGLGIAVGPVIFAGAIVLGSFAIACVAGAVPGVVGGAVQAVKHHIKMKNAPQVAAATAAVVAAAPATPQVSEKVSQIVDAFVTLPQQSREALFAELEKMSGDPSRYPAEKMATAIQKMPDAERVALIEKLQEKLSSDFGVVAAKQAVKQREEELEVYSKPIAFKNRAKPAVTS